MSIRTVRSSVLRSDTAGSSAAASSLSSLSVAPSRSASRLNGGFEVMYTGGGELVVGAIIIIDEGGTGSLGRRCPAVRGPPASASASAPTPTPTPPTPAPMPSPMPAPMPAPPGNAVGPSTGEGRAGENGMSFGAVLIRCVCSSNGHQSDVARSTTCLWWPAPNTAPSSDDVVCACACDRTVPASAAGNAAAPASTNFSSSWPWSDPNSTPTCAPALPAPLAPPAPPAPGSSAACHLLEMACRASSKHSWSCRKPKHERPRLFWVLIGSKMTTGGAGLKNALVPTFGTHGGPSGMRGPAGLSDTQKRRVSNPRVPYTCKKLTNRAPTVGLMAGGSSACR
mmetsp:Transcript_16740/g.34967  ORF Transcript_16740/g.34967 Transcript_16740/m.34967 type:complete len:339 (+) Transcript_16740:153-1169(+)